MNTETTAEPDKSKEQDSQKEEVKPPDPAKRRRGFLLLGIVVILLCAVSVIWYLHSRTYEETDDAQIDGHLNPIAARVAGTIKAVYVEDNEYVEAGKPLLDLDTTDSEITAAQNRAQYAQAAAQLRGEQPNLPITLLSNKTDSATANAEVANARASLSAAEHDYSSAVSQLRQSEADNNKAQADLRRYQQLLEKREVAQSDYDQYNSTAKSKAAAESAQKETVAAAASTVEQKQAQLTEQKFKQQQTIKNAPRQLVIKAASIEAKSANLESIQAQMEQDRLNIAYCHLVAPVAGLISQRSAEIGGRISVGQQLMVLVQTNDLWVTANFKETQLKKIHAHQRVSIKVDALEKTFEGYVESMPAATGDRTSTLPPENATGNYVKIVQRLAVRIRFQSNQEGLQELRPGMSVEPTVHF